MAVSEKDIKLLWGKSAGLCAYPDCLEELALHFDSVSPFTIGEMAHVIAKQPDGPRGNPQGGDDTYNNLVLLCPTHHTMIDKAPEGTYIPEIILDWKRRHEAYVKESITAKKCQNIDELKKEISTLLIENKSIWNLWGPESNFAKQNLLSNTVEFWQFRKLDKIIPNNNKIINLIEKSIYLLNRNQKEIFYSFKQHAEGFERNTYERMDFYPQFPIAFEKEFLNG
jgi:hypothetical protein